METRIARQTVLLVQRMRSAISRFLACGSLTPAQKAKLEAMDKDYEELLGHRREARQGASSKTPKQNPTEAVIKSGPQP